MHVTVLLLDKDPGRKTLIAIMTICLLAHYPLGKKSTSHRRMRLEMEVVSGGDIWGMSYTDDHGIRRYLSRQLQ